MADLVSTLGYLITSLIVKIYPQLLCAIDILVSFATRYRMNTRTLKDFGVRSYQKQHVSVLVRKERLK